MPGFRYREIVYNWKSASNRIEKKKDVGSSRSLFRIHSVLVSLSLGNRHDAETALIPGNNVLYKSKGLINNEFFYKYVDFFVVLLMKKVTFAQTNYSHSTS